MPILCKAHTVLHCSSEHTAYQLSSFSLTHSYNFLAASARCAHHSFTLPQPTFSTFPFWDLMVYTPRKEPHNCHSCSLMEEATALHCTFTEVIVNKLLPVFNLQCLTVFIVKDLISTLSLCFLASASLYTSSRLKILQLRNFTSV